MEEEVDERPEEQSGEDESTVPPQEEDEEEGGGGGGGVGGGGDGENEDEPHVGRPKYQQESEENSDYTGQDEDQDVHESKRKKPHTVVKKPEFSGYFFGSRDKNKKIM